MAKESDGLMILDADAKPGTPLRDLLGLDDICIELKLTPNRPDCLGLLGLAMKSLPVGTAYGIWVGIGALGTVLLGIFIFGESASPARLTQA